MKKITIVLCVLFPMFVNGQNRIMLNDESKLFGYITKCQDSVIIFEDYFTKDNSYTINISKLVYIEGYIPKYHKKEIKKYNAKVTYRNDAYTRNEINNEKNMHPEIQKEIPIVVGVQQNPSNSYSSTYQPTSGDLLQLAGKRYLTGVGVGLGGGVLAIVGASQENTTLTYIGGGAMIVGAIISITGHFKLIEAGKAMNREAITLSASDSGIGLAINF